MSNRPGCRNYSRVCPAVTRERRENKKQVKSNGATLPNSTRQILICNFPGCKARAFPLPDGKFLERCYDHAGPDERAEYLKRWNVS
jgi:hypothetical protein